MALKILSEDTVDDLLYLARTADLTELQNVLEQAAQEAATTPYNILKAAKDPHTGNTTLHMAAANGHQEVIKMLLGLQSTDSASPHNSDTSTSFIDLPNNSGNTPLHWAALNGHLEAVKLLVDAGADLLVKNNAGHDVAYEAELAGKEEVVNWLLSAENYDEAQVNEEEGDATPSEETVVENGESSTG